MSVLLRGAASQLDPSAPIGELCASFESGTFTTARVEHGEIRHLGHHEARLLRESTLDELDPDLVDELHTEVHVALDEASQAAKVLGQGMVRIAVGRSESGVCRMVASGPARRTPFRPESVPLKIGLSPDPRRAPVRKSIRRDDLVEIDKVAKRAGLDGVVLVGPEGIREGTWFHIAIKTVEGWVTPPLGAFVGLGTQRAAFMEANRVIERVISPDELLASINVVALSALLGQGKVSMRADLVITGSHTQISI